MSDRSPAVELRRSVALLATEWWLLVGAGAGYLLYGMWVVATGLAVEMFEPGFATTDVGLVAVGGVAWLLVPAVVAVWLLDRQLSNVNGNLVSQYRINDPGVLPAPPGVLMVLATVVALVIGPRLPVVFLMAVASVHLLVRTIAFGRRVYSFSVRPLFTLLTALSAVALAAAWLVQAPRLPGQVGTRVASAGVPAVVETGLAATGLASATALGALVAVPALLSGLYLGGQAVVARRVRAKAPLANPDKRAEQRYPIMPPVGDSSRPGPPKQTGSAEPSTTESDAEPDEPDSESADETVEPETGTTDDGSDDSSTDDSSTDNTKSHTQVFSADEPVPEETEAMAAVAEESDDQADEDGWIDDTAIFSPDGASSSDDECGSCGEEIRESVTFCPNCGERVQR